VTRGISYYLDAKLRCLTLSSTVVWNWNKRILSIHIQVNALIAHYSVRGIETDEGGGCGA
jgi:hypothetical protein